MSIDLMDTVASLANFDYIIVEAEEHGRIDDDGNWSGIVRMLIDKEIDIGLATMQIMAERETVIDFTIPYYDMVGYTVLMARPRPKSALFKFLTVLEADVWFCILGAYFFTRYVQFTTLIHTLYLKNIFFSFESFLMYIFDRWSPYSYQNNKEKYEDDDEKKVFTMRECLWFCMTSLTPQVSCFIIEFI